MTRRVDLSAASPRQLEVLHAYLRAGSYKAAAHELRVSTHTIQKHLTELYEVTGARNAAEAAYWLGVAKSVGP